jgi:hypothetical protein
MRAFTAHSDGHVLVPDEPVELPSGSRYRVTIEPIGEDVKGLPLTGLALELAGQMEGDYPRDLARNHDHYLHGRRKR